MAAVRGEGVFEAARKVKGLRKKHPKTQRPQYCDYQRESGCEEGGEGKGGINGDEREGKGGINGDGRRLDLGWRTHSTVIDAVL